MAGHIGWVPEGPEGSLCALPFGYLLRLGWLYFRVLNKGLSLFEENIVLQVHMLVKVILKTREVLV